MGCIALLQGDGADISPWHDVALFNEDGTLNFFCEIAMDTTAKFEVATVRVPAPPVCWALTLPYSIKAAALAHSS